VYLWSSDVFPDDINLNLEQLSMFVRIPFLKILCFDVMSCMQMTPVQALSCLFIYLWFIVTTLPVAQTVQRRMVG
jgi:hypothetical protein